MHYDSDPVVKEVREKRRKELQVLTTQGKHRGAKAVTFEALPHFCSVCSSDIPHPSCARFYVDDEDKTYVIERGSKSVREAMLPLLRVVCLNCHALKKWEGGVAEYATKKKEWKDDFG